MGFTPRDISAVESKKDANLSSSILYYLDDYSTLVSLIAPQTKSANNNVNYDLTEFVQVIKGNKFPVKPMSAKLDAVAYDFNGSHEVRIYYVGDKNNSKAAANQLLELVNHNGGKGDWEDGALNKLGLKTSINSPISANVAEGQGNLKVFYNDEGSQLRCAWVVLGSTSWTSEELVAKPGFSGSAT